MKEQENNELMNEIERMKKDLYKILSDKNANIHATMHDNIKKLHLSILALQIICYINSSNLKKIIKKKTIDKKNKNIIKFYCYVLKQISISLNNALSEYEKYKFLYKNLFQ